jgi:hypothetical protein
MTTAFTSETWEGALRSFLIHLKAVRAKKTVTFYGARLRQLSSHASAPPDWFWTETLLIVEPSTARNTAFSVTFSLGQP